MNAMDEMLRGLRCDRTSNDRRRHPRVGLRLRITCASDDGGEPLAGWLRDISAGGVGMLLPGELRIDQQIVLKLPMRGREIASICCRVVHCTKVGSFWRCGAEFVQKPWPSAKPTVTPSAASPPKTDGLRGQLDRLAEAVLQPLPAMQ